MSNRDILVAAPAYLHRWIVGVTRSGCSPVTVRTGYVQLIDMDMVVECDRLGGAGGADPVCFAFMGGLRPKKSQAKRRR